MYVELIEKWREYHRRSMQLFSINSEGEAAVRDFASWLDRNAAQQGVQRIGGTCRVCRKPAEKHVPGGHKFIPLNPNR